MKYWITTDTHFGHRLLVNQNARPNNFESQIISKLRNTLSPDDVLIHLGDISFQNDTIWNKLFMKVSPCKKWLLKGNHDKHSDTWYLEHGWDFVADQIRMQRFGKKIVLSHIPIADDGYDLNIHGHFHDANKRFYEPELVAIRNNKQILVALEITNYMPITLKQLIPK